MLSCSDITHPGLTAVDGSPNERTRFALLTNFRATLLAISIKLKALIIPDYCAVEGII